MRDESENLVRRELASLAEKNGGILRPESVVEFARDENTALHSRFEWSNTKAAHEYRLWQARHLIKVIVQYEPRVESNVQVYVSLPLDRKEEGGGYRRMVDVLSDSQRRSQMLEAALAELDVFQRKYALLKELADVFTAARKARRVAGKSNPKRRQTVLAR